jgi:hypothetical protein
MIVTRGAKPFASHTCTPLAFIRLRPQMLSCITRMELHISQGQDEDQVKNELQALLKNGWKLNEDQEIEKTYHFKLYTKVLVSVIVISLWGHLKILGFSSRSWSGK